MGLMYRVRGIWTNGLGGRSTETEGHVDTKGFKLAPDVSRIHIQLTLWMGMKPEWKKQMLGCNCLEVR